jgi:Tfp pilus assembly protein PilN
VMDEARTVLRRLDRIEALDRQDAPASALLEELRALVRDAETWLRAEPEPSGAVEALTSCRDALEVQSRELTLLAR